MRLFQLTNLKVLTLCLGMATVPAWAFQESKVAPADKSAGSPAAPQLQAPDVKDGRAGVQLSAPEVGKGTEVRIPGLGKLGVLPKLDFGLDILYGAAEDRRLAPGSQGATDEVTIKGSLKHKF